MTKLAFDLYFKVLSASLNEANLFISITKDHKFQTNETITIYPNFYRKNAESSSMPDLGVTW